MSSDWKDEGQMLRTQIAAAIGCARANALDEIMREVWTRYSAGQLSEEDAGQLSALAQERRAAWRGSGQAALGLVLPPPAERCPTPVRRRSYFKGRSEGRIWQATTRKDVQAILKAAEIYNEAGLHEKGERSGPLGSVALDVLRLFVNLIDFRTGRLEPSITTIMDRLGRSRDTIVRALKNLRAHGFIDWLRRYEPTGNEGRGPQVQQASNAYRLSLPEKALRLLGRFGKAPPPPDDHVAAQAARAAELDAYRKALPLDELALFEADNNPLGQALAALGKSLQERESAKQTESPSQSTIAVRT
jgi:hypothetical protein